MNQSTRDRLGAGWRMMVTAGLLLSWPPSLASANPPPTGPGDATKLFPPTSFLTQRETWAAVAVLVFGLMLGLLALLVMRQRTVPAEEVIRLSALVLIVTGTLFLVVAGYSGDQIAPALGLLGTVAGYLLGRADRNATDRVVTSKKQSDATDT